MGSNVESIVQDTAGNFYVGQADGTADILKLDKNTGAIIDRFNVPTGNRGSDWIDLAADQRTMFYTSEGNRVHRYDLVTRTALPDFQTVPLTGPLYCVKILRDGRVLVAATDKVYLLSPTGTIVRTYTVSGEGLFFAASLDPDGTSFWSGGLITNRFWKFDIATGALLLTPPARPSRPPGTRRRAPSVRMRPVPRQPPSPTARNGASS